MPNGYQPDPSWRMADQSWFWIESGKACEREVNERVASDHVPMHESTDVFRTHLDEVDSAVYPALKFGASGHGAIRVRQGRQNAR